MIPVGGALVASTAVIEADITLGDRVSVWWNAVLRGDDAALTVGDDSVVCFECSVVVAEVAFAILGERQQQGTAGARFADPW